MRVVWERGGEGAIVRLAGDAITLSSTVPAPPGARVKGTLEHATLAAPVVIQVKSHGSKKQPDGSFVIEGRTIDMTRETKALIVAAVEKKTE